MTIRRSIELATADRIGRDGANADGYLVALERTGAALAWLRARHADGALPLLRLPAKRDDLAEIQAAAHRVAAGATDIVFLGTGGSSLGGQMLAQFAGHGVAGLGLLRPPPRVHFLDNLDPVSLGAVYALLPLATTRFVAISKSGVPPKP